VYLARIHVSFHRNGTVFQRWRKSNFQGRIQWRFYALCFRFDPRPERRLSPPSSQTRFYSTGDEQFMLCRIFQHHWNFNESTSGLWLQRMICVCVIKLACFTIVSVLISLAKAVYRMLGTSFISVAHNFIVRWWFVSIEKPCISLSQFYRNWKRTAATDVSRAWRNTSKHARASFISVLQVLLKSLSI